MTPEIQGDTETGPGQAHGMETAYSLYDALIGINVPSDKARAVAQALERDMTATFVTKPDLEVVHKDLRREIELLRKDLRTEIELIRKDVALQRSSLIIWLGSAQVATAGLLFTALQIFGR